ncbi:MAG: hypothetical protein JWQ74_2889 [Marmoricola sp.]|nr:hypothetical protein [Marmoricola sp.]
MKTLVGRVLGLVILAAIIGIGAVNVDSGDVTADNATITDYKAVFDVGADGTLTAVETLKVDFPTYADKHGIFRFFDTRVPNFPKNRLIPTDVTITRNGQSEPFEELKESRGRYRNFKIGSADATVEGENTYQISYRIKGALTHGFDGAQTQFYWNLIPQGWRMPTKQYDLVVHLPAAGTDIQCGVGVGADTTTCQVASTDGGKTLEVKGGSISPNVPVTVKTNLAIATPEANTRAWSSNLDPLLGQHPVLLGFVLLLALAAAVGGSLLSLSVREKAPPYPLMYAPPEGIGPAQAAYLLTEKVENKAFVATMMYAAEQGAVTLQQDGAAWTMTGTDKPETWAKLDAVTAQSGEALGVLNPGGSFTASSQDVAAGKQLKTVLSSFEADTEGWAKTNGLMVTSGLGGFGAIVLIAGLVATVWLGAFNPFNMSLIALVPGLFVITALGVGATGAGTRRTPAGRDLWSRIGGFRRILSTPSAQDRFDFSGRKELYTSYLPWAVAFDCADEWAKKYRIETGEEPPVPGFLPVYAGVHAGNYVNQMVDSFDSSVSSAISAYDATQSSSSSGGGGGFSGGGGGGGGGGGSW